MKTDTRKQVIDKLKGDFVVTQMRKDWDKNGELMIVCNFECWGKEGYFEYYLYGESGIGECEFDEEDKEDIYAEIHNWVEEHIYVESIVKCDGKEI